MTSLGDFLVAEVGENVGEATVEGLGKPGAEAGTISATYPAAARGGAIGTWSGLPASPPLSALRSGPFSSIITPGHGPSWIRYALARKRGRFAMADSQRDAWVHNAQLIQKLSMFEGMCDVTFRSNRAPLMGVRISSQVNSALQYGAGATRMLEEYKHIRTKSGDTFDLNDVWVIVPLPNGEPSEVDLAGVDLADHDAEVASGVSMRQMAREIYKCTTDAQAELMLRRVLAA